MRSLNSNEPKLWDTNTGLCVKAYRDPLDGIKRVNQLCLGSVFYCLWYVASMHIIIFIKYCMASMSIYYRL